jgi:hypothetical protein
MGLYLMGPPFLGLWSYSLTNYVRVLRQYRLPKTSKDIPFRFLSAEPNRHVTCSPRVCSQTKRAKPVGLLVKSNEKARDGKPIRSTNRLQLHQIQTKAWGGFMKDVSAVLLATLFVLLSLMSLIFAERSSEVTTAMRASSRERVSEVGLLFAFKR